MTLQELIARFRAISGDDGVPPLWADETVMAWLNEAQAQAAIRGRLIYEDSDPAVCKIALDEGQRTYPLHPKLFEIRHASILDANLNERPIELKSVEWLDRHNPRWRTNSNNRPAFAIVQTDTNVRVVGAIRAGESLSMEVFRLPLSDMVNGDDKPELHEAHHKHLVFYAIGQAFGTVDADGYDPARAKTADGQFVAHFGIPVDSDMQRIRRLDYVANNVSFY